MKLSQLIDTKELARLVESGHVARREHPEFPYSIYNYTLKTAFEKAWNDVTMTCRGLIVDSGENVIARPFKKFFNHRQPGCPQLSHDTVIAAYDKLDGSLGILYPTPDGRYAVASRGSFDSDQALTGTRIWREKYEGKVHVPAGATYLFEIIYRENRVVVEYGFSDLVWLGGMDIETGRTHSSPESAGMPGNPAGLRVAERLPYGTLAQALAAPPRKNAEGMVLWAMETDERIKIKQEDYLALHKIIAGLSERAVWERLDNDLDGFIAGLPDEFQGWASDIARELREKIQLTMQGLRADYDKYLGTLPQGFSRKDFAMGCKNHPNKGALFHILDGKDLYNEAYQRCRPEANATPQNLRVQTEDTN